MQPGWLINGRPGSAVAADDRGLAYGDGLFETIAWRDGVPRLWHRHLLRLETGCRKLGLAAPDPAQLEDEMRMLAAGRSRGVLKLLLTRGSGRRGYAPPDEQQTTRLLGFFPDLPDASPPGSLVVGLCQTPASLNPILAGLKTLNRLDNVLARAEVAQRGLDEGIMCTPDGQVVGGTAANLFGVRDGVLYTPAMTRAGVAGVMRAQILECAAALGLAVEESIVEAEDLRHMEELFLSNALTGLRSIAALEGQTCTGAGIASALRKALRSCGVHEEGG